MNKYFLNALVGSAFFVGNAFAHYPEDFLRDVSEGNTSRAVIYAQLASGLLREERQPMHQQAAHCFATVATHLETDPDNADCRVALLSLHQYIEDLRAEKITLSDMLRTPPDLEDRGGGAAAAAAPRLSLRERLRALAVQNPAALPDGTRAAILGSQAAGAAADDEALARQLQNELDAGMPGAQRPPFQAAAQGGGEDLEGLEELQGRWDAIPVLSLEEADLRVAERGPDVAICNRAAELFRLCTQQPGDKQREETQRNLEAMLVMDGVSADQQRGIQAQLAQIEQAQQATRGHQVQTRAQLTPRIAARLQREFGEWPEALLEALEAINGEI